MDIRKEWTTAAEIASISGSSISLCEEALSQFVAAVNGRWEFQNGETFNDMQSSVQLMHLLNRTLINDRFVNKAVFHNN